MPANNTIVDAETTALVYELIHSIKQALPDITDYNGDPKLRTLSQTNGDLAEALYRNMASQRREEDHFAAVLDGKAAAHKRLNIHKRSTILARLKQAVTEVEEIITMEENYANDDGYDSDDEESCEEENPAFRRRTRSVARE